ncbi:UNVERIFIED_CONTAM: hypothetical protein GTU68_065540, partial [Idotea baltica]|nr:hypothetical protein [Idotea baltica]
MTNDDRVSANSADVQYDIVIVGAGAAGIATASSIVKRSPELNIAIIDPSDVHYYQPGWTMVGGGIFKVEKTVKSMATLIPKNVGLIKAAVTEFEPKKNLVKLDDNTVVQYDRLVVCPGLKLDWDKIDGLSEALGKNGVTSNYRQDLAPYTWELVKSLKKGKAIFTQPPMPIKCAGAPQKALYLSADHWYRSDTLKNVDIEFKNAGAVLFGVQDYVPILTQYMDKYGVNIDYHSNLVAVDGEKKLAWFDRAKPDTETERVEVPFDMLHVCPPQSTPGFIRTSELADATGWVDVDQQTLRHKKYSNIWSLGDVTNTPNAKTAAAARKQAPIVAANII